MPQVEPNVPEEIAKLKNTHLMDWLEYGYDHCQRGSKDWCQGYLDSARKYISALEAALSSAPALEEPWKPIETCPYRERDQEILTWDGAVWDVASCWWLESGEPVWFNGEYRVHPTHWRHPPTPPAEGE